MLASCPVYKLAIKILETVDVIKIMVSGRCCDLKFKKIIGVSNHDNTNMVYNLHRFASLH